MAKKLQILLEVKADGTVAIDKVVGQLGRVGKEADEAGKATRGFGAELSSLNVKGGQIAGTLLTAITGASAAVAALSVAVVGVGVRHNAQLEQSKLAMAALASSMGEITDVNGRVLQGQERWNAALGISEGLVKKLQLAAIQTTAEFGDLVRVMQEGMGPALQAKFDEQQIVKFVQMIAQTGGALGIAGDRLGQEIRAVLAGERGPDNQIANALFGDMTDVKAKIAELKKSGELFDFLAAKMSGFAKAGESAGDTFDGALSNLKDAITQALGEATQGATRDFTNAMQDLTSQIVTFDEAGNAVFNPEFVAGVKSVADALGEFATFSAMAARALPELIEQIKDYAAVGKTLNDTNFMAAYGPALRSVGLGSVVDVLNPPKAKPYSGPGVGGDATGAYAYDYPIGPMPPVNLGAKPPGPGGDGGASANALKKRLDDYRAWMDETRALADAAGDPLKEALAKIEADRLAAIAKIDEANKKLKGAINAPADKVTINQLFDQKVLDELLEGVERRNKETLESLKKTTEAAKESAAAAAGMLGDIQREGEAERIAAIEDSVERELQTRLAANDEWYEQMLATVEKEITVQEEKDEVLAKLAEEKKRRDEEAVKAEEKARRESIAGTEEWARKVHATIVQNLGTIADDMEAVLSDSTMALRGAFDNLFAGIVDGQFNLVDTFRSLSKQLGNIWGQTLSSILSRTLSAGESITTQLKGMWDSFGQGADGKTSIFDSAMGGAGIGSLVGGLGAAIMGPGNYAAEGGTIGGALGAAIGAYFGAPQIGAIIGSAIGTAVGGAIGKDGDWIKVAIKDGILTVTEEGLSASGRQQLERELEKAIGEQVKGWNSILELFPVEMQQQLKDLVKPLDITGGIEGGDIKDAGAMQALTDFLTDTLNRSLYGDYIMAIQKGLQGIGVSDERIKQMFGEWGALQGEELQGAVREYIETLVDSVRVRDLFKPFDPGSDSGDIRGDARDAIAAQKPEARIKTMIADLGVLVSNLPKLDPTDQIAAMQQVNQLGQQIWDNMIAHLQRIDAIQASIAQSAQSMRDQITLAGLDDQGKMDFYFEGLRDVREKMSGATDPEEIQRLYQQAMGYVSSALALDPDNKALQDQLLAIVNDLEGVSGEQLDEARDRVMEEQLKAFELLEKAAQTLLDAVNGTPSGPIGPEVPPIVPEPPDPDDPKPKDPRDPFTQLNTASDAAAKGLEAFATTVATVGQAISSSIERDLELQISKAPYPTGIDPVILQYLMNQIPSHASGLASVPYDGYIARLHQGERVMPASAVREMERDKAASAVSVTVELSGPGADFMRQMGVEVQRSIVRSLRNNPRLMDPGYDA